MSAGTWRRGATVVVVAAGLAVGTSRLLAHDFWIQPSTFRPKPGTTVELRFLVGEGLIGEVLPRNTPLIDTFVASGPDGIVVVPGQHGRDPAGVIRVTQPGVVVVGYRSRRSSTELAPEAFERYLAEEGLEHIVKRAALRPLPGRPVREVFSRCAKALLLAGPPNAQGSDRPLGFTLELVAGKNPYGLRPGDDLPIRLLYDGAPLADALVVALNREGSGVKVQARSDRDGRVALRLDRPGAWLIKAVHLVPAPADVGADWESFWASLTFEIGR